MPGGTLAESLPTPLLLWRRGWSSRGGSQGVGALPGVGVRWVSRRSGLPRASDRGGIKSFVFIFDLPCSCFAESRSIILNQHIIYLISVCFIKQAMVIRLTFHLMPLSFIVLVIYIFPSSVGKVIVLIIIKNNINSKPAFFKSVFRWC